MRYAIHYHKTGTGYAASVPDLPSIIVAAATFKECQQLAHEAIRVMSDWINEEGEFPEPSLYFIELYEVAA